MYPGLVASDTATVGLGTSPAITMDSNYTIATLSLSGTGALSLGGSGVLTVTSAVSVGSSQILQGTGTLNAPISLAGGALEGTLTTGAITSTGGIFDPGDTGATHAVGTITTTGNFSSSSASVFNYDVGTSSDLIAVTGNVTLAGTLNATAGTGFGYGRYTLMTYTGTLTNSLAIGTMPTLANSRFTVGSSAGIVYLDVAPTSYTFNGSTWNSSASWTPNDGIHYPGTGDTATFAIGGTSTRAVSLGGNEAVGTMNFTSTTPYTFDTSGSTNILTVGSGGINDNNPGTQIFNNVLAGSGTSITLNPTTEVMDQYHTLWTDTVQLANTANTFSGAVNVYGGVLQANGDAALGNASNTITLGSVGAIGELYQYSGSSVTTTRNITLAGQGGELAADNGNPFYYNGVLSGSGELILGSGNWIEMTSPNNSTYTGGTVILNPWCYIGSIFTNGGPANTTTADVLGTGGVKVEYGGLAIVNCATNLGIGTFSGTAYNPPIFVGGTDRNTNPATSFRPEPDQRQLLQRRPELPVRRLELRGRAEHHQQFRRRSSSSRATATPRSMECWPPARRSRQWPDDLRHQNWRYLHGHQPPGRHRQRLPLRRVERLHHQQQRA